MKLNDRNVASFAVCSSPIDKEGYLSKRGNLNQSYQRRWFILKGNLLFYFEKKRDKEPVGVIILEHCSVQASEHEKHALEISFDGSGTRTYVLLADNESDMQAWIRAISHASYEYLKSIVRELQERLDGLVSRKSSTVEQVGAGVKRLQVKEQTQAVVNGHLIDLDEEESPLTKTHPLQQRYTYYGGKGGMEAEDIDVPKIPEKKKRSNTSNLDTTPINFQHPHASPIEQSYHYSSATLSPKSSFDHTACLMPEVCTLPMRSEPSLIDFDNPPLMPQRSLTPPATTEAKQKTFEEIHDEFTDVMKTLRHDQPGS